MEFNYKIATETDNEVSNQEEDYSSDGNGNLQGSRRLGKSQTHPPTLHQGSSDDQHEDHRDDGKGNR